MIVMVQVADLSHENFKSSHEVVTLSTFKSFWCQVKLWTQTQVTPRSIPHYQCWIENLCNLLSLQYKENKGKFAASNGRLKANSFSASGGLCPLTPWPGAAPLGALPPDPRYRLALPRSPKMPSLWPPLFVTFRGPWWCCLRDPTFSRFDTIPACDTDRHTDTRSWLLLIEIEPEQFLVLFRPGTTSIRSGLGTFFVPEPEHAKHFLCS